VHAVLTTYGVEAARATILHEVQVRVGVCVVLALQLCLPAFAPAR
jgi:hypothetical protein